MKVLIVDDEPSVLDLTSRALLREPGFETTLCDNGVEAMARARAVRPDVILLDLMMPTMTGVTFLEHLQRDSETRGIPVILLTGADPPAVDTVRGVVGVIRKPFDVDSLAAQIRQLVGDR